MSPALAPFAAFAWVGLVSVVEQIVLRSASRAPLVRSLSLAYTMLELLSLGAIASLVVQLRAALPRRRPPGWLVVFAASLASLPVILPDDLVGLRRLVREPVLRDNVVAFTVATAIVIVTVFFLGASWLSRKSVGPPLLLGFAAVGAAAHAPFFARDYPGLHLAAELFAAMHAAIALAAVRPPPAIAALVARRGRALTIGVAAIALSLLAPIPNAVRADMFGSAASPVAPFALRLQRMPERRPHADAGAEPWFEPRRAAAPTPPTTPPLLPRDAVVVLLTIDALRADVVRGRAFDARIPNLARLRDQGVSFANARTPAPQTVIALTSLFTSKYYTQLFFSGDQRLHAYPTHDGSKRFPEILASAGVATVAYPLTVELDPRTGVLKGFTEIGRIKPQGDRQGVLASECAPAIALRVERAATTGEPTFIYAHWLDPHYPYDGGGTDCAPFECYLREVSRVDEAIGQVLRALDTPALRGRAALFVSADHGEAFDDHDTVFHGLTLYDELLAVPLIAYGASFAPRVVREPVSLVDLAPTLLDLFGQRAPRGFMGQSLVPILAGGDEPLARPIAADSGRLMQAYVFHDGVKIIRDNRHNFVEMYDLKRDPAERLNVFGSAPDAAERLGVLDALFAANAHRYEGRPPFRM